MHGAPRLQARLKDILVPVVNAVNAGVKFGKIFKCGPDNAKVDFSTKVLLKSGLKKALTILEVMVKMQRRLGVNSKNLLMCTLDAMDALIAHQYVSNPEELKSYFIREAYDYYMARTPPVFCFIFVFLIHQPPRDCSGWEWFSCTVDDVKDAFTTAGNWIEDTGKSAWEETRDIGMKTYEGLKTAGCNVWDGSLELLKKTMDAAVSFLEVYIFNNLKKYLISALPTSYCWTF